MIQNKAPGKDVSAEDMAEKFPLASKKNSTHFSKFDIAGVSFGENLIPIMAGPNMVESEKLNVETAINGKNMPNDAYNVGINFSITNSTDWTVAAIVAINEIKIKKLKSIFSKPIQANAPSFNKKLLIAQLIGIVIDITNITAIPKPNAVLTFLEQAKNEHIPKNNAKSMFSIKIDFNAILTKSIIYF